MSIFLRLCLLGDSFFNLLFTISANPHGPTEEGGGTTPYWLRAAQLKAYKGYI